jgi:hypothetical protein
MIARGLAAILTVRERRHGDKTDGPPRCLRCHRELTGKVPPFRGIGRDCWRSMLRIKATDPDAPTMPTDEHYVLVWDRKGRLHHNVPAKYLPPNSMRGMHAEFGARQLGYAILASTGLVSDAWLPHLYDVFCYDFLCGPDSEPTIIKGADVLAWIMEHTRRGDA